MKKIVYRLYFSGTTYEYWEYPNKTLALKWIKKYFNECNKDKQKATIILKKVIIEDIKKYRNY
jgi:hypothetical protein